MKTIDRKNILAARRARHHAALASLHANPQAADGLAMWRKLRRIESVAHAAATAQCNGEAYAGQPFRPDYLPDGSEGTEENLTPWEAFSEGIRADVAKVFGGKLPDGFILNQDCRGYALKIRGPEAGRPGGLIPEGLETDWGGNGILAVEINDI